MPDSNSQSIEDNGLTRETIAESASRRLLAAFKSEGSICFISSDCNTADATPGTAVQFSIVSARFSGALLFPIARENRTIFKPQAIGNAQIPTIVIAVKKRIYLRIAINVKLPVCFP